MNLLPVSFLNRQSMDRFPSSLFMHTCVQKLYLVLIWSCKEHIESKDGSSNAVHSRFAPECLTDEVNILEFFFREIQTETIVKYTSYFSGINSWMRSVLWTEQYTCLLPYILADFVYSLLCINKKYCAPISGI